MNSTGMYVPLLRGIGFAGYRSFAAWQEFSFATKVTVLAGINNSGKSNVLRFLQEGLPKLRSGGPGIRQAPANLTLSDLDRPRGFSNLPALEVGIPIALGSFGERRDTWNPRRRFQFSSLGDIQEVVMSLLCGTDSLYWSRFTMATEGALPTDYSVDTAISLWPTWENDFRTVLNLMGGGAVNARSVMQSILMSIGGFASPPNVVTVSGARRVEATDEVGSEWLSGLGLIRALAAIQSPSHEKWEESRPQWSAINRFVQTVLGDPDASLNVPFDFSTIQVETPQRVLPLASLGSGVEQVIVLAAAATITTNSLICIEEPETNLHPLLQKKLLRFLTDETDNQYIIATHSSHLLDDMRATAYHVRLTTEGSVAQVARRPYELVEVCHDLGYRPSDLLQANCVIWLEGPSDRIYLRRWIELVDPSLTEGVDYSLMFYGGSLLAHLTASEEALKDFISLRRLNRASAVLIDSDKTSARMHINSTKKRIRDEFDASDPAPGFSWVTKCFTIENYLPPKILEAAVGAVHPKVAFRVPGQWENPLPARKIGPVFDKVGIAGAAVPMLEAEHLDRFDLSSRVTALRDFVLTANGQSIAPRPGN